MDDELKDTMYSEWRSDHLSGLKDDFIEERQDDFDTFCREAFKNRYE